MTWREASNYAGACYACSLSVKPPNLQAAWYVKTPEDERRLYEHWHHLACFRVSQIGERINQPENVFDVMQIVHVLVGDPLVDPSNKTRFKC